MTQERLASLAGISTPTVSRFENGIRDITLSSVMKILRVLGMVDERVMEFDDPAAGYDLDRDLVYFTGQIGSEAVPCAISREALEDHFEKGKKSLLQTYQANSVHINHEARRKYLAQSLESNGSILIRTEDF